MARTGARCRKASPASAIRQYTLRAPQGAKSRPRGIRSRDPRYALSPALAAGRLNT